MKKEKKNTKYTVWVLQGDMIPSLMSSLSILVYGSEKVFIYICIVYIYQLQNDSYS